jgi:mannose-1-phosphate guanylyltransferase
MKIIIFAGGSGTRFWPISKTDYPKQFVKVVDNKSTLQKTVSRVSDMYGWNNIYVSTNEKYVSVIKDQAPNIANSNILTEPAKRDVGPAVGLALFQMQKMGVKEPIFISWADHLIENLKEFQQKLKQAEEMVLKQDCKIVFWGEKPKFANHDFGWIKLKDKNKYDGLIYRPEPKKCEEMFKSGMWFWNTGYFVTTADYILDIYKQNSPKMYTQLKKIAESIGTVKENETMQSIYPKINPVSFDEAVVYNIKKQDAGVIVSDMGWVDPGTLYALKKYYKDGEDNYIKGLGIFENSKDSMIFNSEKKLVAAAGLDSHVVVNTKDVVYVVHKNNIGDVKELLAKMEENKKFKKYL